MKANVAMMCLSHDNVVVLDSSFGPNDNSKPTPPSKSFIATEYIYITIVGFHEHVNNGSMMQNN